MQSEIDYTKGWNDVMRRLSVLLGNPEAIQEYFRKINKAFEKIRTTHYARGVFAALKSYQEEILAPEMAA